MGALQILKLDSSLLVSCFSQIFSFLVLLYLDVVNI